jgi:hypothetical protein
MANVTGTDGSAKDQPLLLGATSQGWGCFALTTGRQLYYESGGLSHCCAGLQGNHAFVCDSQSAAVRIVSMDTIVEYWL